MDAKPVTLDNWAMPPGNRWAFMHMDEVLATAPVAAAPTASPLPAAALDLDEVAVPRHDRLGRVIGHGQLAEVLEQTWTDGFAVAHRGRVLVEQYRGELAPPVPHLLMSVTKTVVGAIVLILAEHGLLRIDQPVDHIVPELADSGFAGASLQDLLDMRSGVRFSEAYHDPEADVYLMEHAVGWRSPRPGVPATMHAYLASLPRHRLHGRVFQYRSSETNVLGWACETVTGRGLAHLVHELVWAPMGAEHAGHITVDAAGHAVGDGGLSASLRDTLRLAELIRRNGVSHDGMQVLPSWYVTDTLLAEDDSRRVFARADEPAGMPGGHYRNQVWLPFPHRSVLLGLGIHGQMVYVNQRAGVSGVKLSTWPTAQDAVAFYDTLGAFEAISRHVSPSAARSDRDHPSQ